MMFTYVILEIGIWASLLDESETDAAMVTLAILLRRPANNTVLEIGFWLLATSRRISSVKVHWALCIGRRGHLLNKEHVVSKLN